MHSESFLGDYIPNQNEFDVRIENGEPVMLYRPHMGGRSLRVIIALILAIALIPLSGCIIAANTLTSDTPTKTVALFAVGLVMFWLVLVGTLLLYIRRLSAAQP